MTHYSNSVYQSQSSTSLLLYRDALLVAATRQQYNCLLLIILLLSSTNKLLLCFFNFGVFKLIFYSIHQICSERKRKCTNRAEAVIYVRPFPDLIHPPTYMYGHGAKCTLFVGNVCNNGTIIKYTTVLILDFLTFTDSIDKLGKASKSQTCHH